MKLQLVRYLTIVCVSAVLVLGPCVPFKIHTSAQEQADSSAQLNDLSLPQTQLTAVRATATNQGVLLQWRTVFEIDGLGFVIYRMENGQRTRVNRSLILGRAFQIGEGRIPNAGWAYTWFDPGGTVDSVYYIESIGANGKRALQPNSIPVGREKLLDYTQSADLTTLSAGTSTNQFVETYPTLGASDTQLSTGTLEDQWAIAAQPGLKISIKKDAWYRITQPELAAAGFNLSADVKNLQLFADGREVAILTSRGSGQFSSTDYLEFYGRGLDTPSTDSRVYYLIVGTQPGKRVQGDLHQDSVPQELSTSNPSPQFSLTPPTWSVPFFYFPYTFKTVNQTTTVSEARRATRIPSDVTNEYPPTEITREESVSGTAPAPEVNDPVAPKENAPLNLAREKPAKVKRLQDRDAFMPAPMRKLRKKSSRKKLRRPKREYNHVAASATASDALSFDYTVERKERLVYFAALINGDAENFVGQVPSPNFPVTETLTLQNIQSSASRPAQLEVALQGIAQQSHEVNIFFNDVLLGTMEFFGRDHLTRSFDLTLAQLREGANAVKVMPLGTNSGNFVSVDYLRVTYPHRFRADNDSLRLSLRSSQTVSVDGFTTPNVRLIEYTDPFAVRMIKPIVTPSGSGYAIQIPKPLVRSKASHLFYASSESTIEHPAAMALNQPSSLNLSSNAADLLIVAHRSFMPSMEILASLRSSQGLTASVIDVEDIYDEFSYGAHGPQAIKDFLRHASTHWTISPRYVIFAGDATYDPRNYLGLGNFDFVPTKLVDATFSETASDDWLTDFNDDGIADIPVGRLPVRTVAQANLVVSKIVNFSPTNTPQSALLVADAQGTYFFNFEQANSDVQSLLPASMTVQRVDRRLEPSDAQARADIIAQFNSGQAVVNYSGHGNVDTWTGGSIFTSLDAAALTNGNKLPFVVVNDCLNGFFQDPTLDGIAEALIKAPNGGAVAVFASSGLTIPIGQHEMSTQLYRLLYGPPPTSEPRLGDAISQAKTATFDIDVRRTWILFGDPSIRIR